MFLSFRYEFILEALSKYWQRQILRYKDMYNYFLLEMLYILTYTFINYLTKKYVHITTLLLI